MGGQIGLTRPGQPGWSDGQTWREVQGRFTEVVCRSFDTGEESISSTFIRQAYSKWSEGVEERAQLSLVLEQVKFSQGLSTQGENTDIL